MDSSKKPGNPVTGSNTGANGRTMADRLRQKTDEYEAYLATALAETRITPEQPAERKESAGGCMEMATAYLEDGRHFREEGDLPNALAAFAYGHGWLDAGIRIGVLSVQDSDE